MARFESSVRKEGYKTIKAFKTNISEVSTVSDNFEIRSTDKVVLTFFAFPSKGDSRKVKFQLPQNFKKNKSLINESQSNPIIGEIYAGRAQ